MGKMFRIDVSEISSPIEKSQVTQSFKGYWEIMDEKWVATSLTERSLLHFDVFWSPNLEPEFPSLPKEAKVIPL